MVGGWDGQAAPSIQTVGCAIRGCSSLIANATTAPVLPAAAVMVPAVLDLQGAVVAPSQHHRLQKPVVQPRVEVPPAARERSQKALIT